jgi:hypothetical protein
MSTIGSGIMEAMADFEEAVGQALEMPDSQPADSDRLTAPVLNAIAAIKHDANGKLPGLGTPISWCADVACCLNLQSASVWSLAISPKLTAASKSPQDQARRASNRKLS